LDFFKSLGKKHDKMCSKIRTIINYKRVGMDPNDLEGLVTCMSDVATGIKSVKSKKRRKSTKKLEQLSFTGAEVQKWLEAKFALDKEEAIKLCKNLVHRRLVTSKKGEVRTYEPNEVYLFSVTLENFMGQELRVHLQPEKPSSRSILSFEPVQFARQLTYFEHTLFKKVKYSEINLWVQGKMKDSREKAAPNLYTFINFTNQVSQWVATEIITSANPKQRASVVKRFITIGQYLLKFKNYCGLLEVIGGLKNSAVLRLNSTWKELSKKYEDMFETLTSVISPAQNWKNYRPLIQDDPPFVPYIGVYLSDLTFIKDGNVTYREDGKINWRKVNRLGEVLANIQRAQRVSYTNLGSPDSKILSFLCTELYYLDDRELYTRSKALEPGRVV